MIVIVQIKTNLLIINKKMKNYLLICKSMNLLIQKYKLQIEVLIMNKNLEIEDLNLLEVIILV